MAIWKETLEPYVKVTESVKTASLNPTAGGDLIIGAVIISDSGPGIPTLITSQKEFLAYYATSELTEDYMKQLDSLYVSDPGSSLASTMWLNAYRLAGSTNMLISRAVKGGDMVYAKALVKGDDHSYIIKDTEILRQSTTFKFVLDPNPSDSDGWLLIVSEVGALGNRINDDGALYDYDIYNLPDLVDKLNETTKFFSPDYTFYKNVECKPEDEIEITDDNKEDAVAVVFNEVYLANNFIDNEDDRLGDNNKTTVTTDGVSESFYLGFQGIWAESPVLGHDDTQKTLNLSKERSYAKYETPKYYVTNVYNSNTDLQVRIRRFNHNAVQQKTLSDSEQAQGVSPWTVIKANLDKYTNSGTRRPVDSILKYDFYEFAILDPTISEEWQLFNVGNIPGRGDVTLATVNNSLGMMQLHLPEDLLDLDLNYYDYTADDNGSYYPVVSGGDYDSEKHEYTVAGVTYSIYAFYESKDSLPAISSTSHPVDKTTYVIGSENAEDTTNWELYQFLEKANQQLSQNCKINPKKSSLLNVSNSTLMKAWDAIEEDERYIVEGVTDLGCTYTIIQNYLANIAIKSNYFYPVSTMNSTNYITIANFASKITPLSCKLFLLAPWDYDDGTVGFLFNVCPSVLYWEVVSRNRLNNKEFAAAFGMIQGIINPVNLAKEFNKTQRQLLLTKNINTIYHDLYNELYYINDNKTREASEDILGEECNARFQIRISKAMPVLLRQFHARQINNVLYSDITATIDYWFRSVVLSYGCTVAEYNIICNSSNNSEEDVRAKRVNVKVNVRFYNTAHYIEVYNVAYPIGVAFDES